LGDGAGGFTGSTNIALSGQAWSVDVGDFNGDGKKDLAVGNWGVNGISIFLGDGQEASAQVPQ